MKRSILFILFPLILSSCVGLGTSKFTPVKYYDLGRPQADKLKLNISSINLEGATKTRMLKRVKSESVEVDEYNRWTQAPDSLMTHYLKMAFIPGGDVELSGEILAFENDLTTDKAVLVFHYELSNENKLIYKGVFHSQQESSGSADTFAKAMAKAASELRQHISQRLKR